MRRAIPVGLLGCGLIVGALAGGPAQAVVDSGTSRVVSAAAISDVLNGQGTKPTKPPKPPKGGPGVPRVVDDAVTTDEDSPTTLPAPGVLRNDGPGGSPRSVAAIDGSASAVGAPVALPSGAVLQVDADGAVSLDPDMALQHLPAGERSTETVAITVQHASGATATSTLTLHIDGLNDAPAIDQDDPVEVETRSDAVAGDLALQLTATDIDDGDVLTWSIRTQAMDGVASVDATTGLVDYLPDTGFAGLDEFVVGVSDGNGGTDAVTVLVDVLSAGPVAVDDILSTDEDTVLLEPAPGILGNDLVGLDGPLSVVAVNGVEPDVGTPVELPSGLIVTVGADGAVTVDPSGQFESLAPGGSATDSLTATIENAIGVQDTSAIDVEITGVNDLPVIDQGATIPVQTLTTAAPGELGLVLTATDPDVPDTLTWSIDTAASNGTASVDPVSGAVDYLPDAGLDGEDSFVVAVDDLYGGQDTTTVTVTVVPPNSPPVIDQGPTTTVTMSEDGTPTGFALTLSATDVNGDDLTWAITTDPAVGAAAITPPTSADSVALTFAPPPDYNGSTTFVVTVTDTAATSDTITVTVVVEAVNDPPTVTAPGPFSVIGNVGITVPDGADDLLAGAADAADGPAGLPLAVTPGAGATTQDGAVAVAADGTFSYRPAPGFSGSDSFTYEVCDSGVPGSACTSATVNLTVDAPIWFIDNSAPAGGTGTLFSPFPSTEAFAAAAGTTTGDVYVAETGTDYPTGLSLGANQSLVGEGASGTSLATVLGRTVPAHSNPLPPIGGPNPDITPSSGNGITLGSGNRVLGVDVEVTGAGAGIRGASLGTVTIDDVGVVSSAQGPALDLAGGGGTIDVGAVSTSARTGPGVILTNLTGSVGIASAAIPNPSSAVGNAVHVTGGSAAITIGTATIANTIVGAATTFDATRGLPTSDGNGDGIFIKDLTGSFTLSGGSITSFGDNGVDIRNSRNVTLSGVTIDGNFAGNSGVQAHIAQNLSIVNSTIREIDDVDAAALVTDSGLRLTDIEGTLAITGSTISLSEGYALRNFIVGSAQRAVELDNRQGCTHDGTADCALTVTVSTSTFSQWDFQGLSLRHVGGTMAVSVTGSTFSLINGAAVSTGPASAASTQTHTSTLTNSTLTQVGIAAEVFGSRGGNTTTTIQNNVVTTTTSDAVRLVGFNQPGAGSTGIYRGTVSGNTITGVAGQLHGSGGGSGVFVAAEDSAVVRAAIQNNVIRGHTVTDGNTVEVLRTQNQRNGDLDLTFHDNTTSDFATNFFGAVFIGNDNDTNAGDGVTDTCVDLGNNSYANAAGLFANTHAFDTLGIATIRLPGYTGTTDNALTAYLTGRGESGAVALTFGNQPVNVASCLLPTTP
ncbi:right-handed parallel beta-helix repeat-containing protein [Nostocoides sp. F2B08]|uniref:beta strand repeat-containing protein n=1 Tax=Nostocoides sp. F2B08 TaxID=2653936 RepID=UPI00186B5363|nr:right-handed parallel beta-helix repeat-containing protein [Tetrasphaera sp. F2B08]